MVEGLGMIYGESDSFMGFSSKLIFDDLCKYIRCKAQYSLVFFISYVICFHQFGSLGIFKRYVVVLYFLALMLYALK